MSIIVRYSSNNSGGSWWLSDADWERLADNGWTVHWHQGDDVGRGNTDAAYGEYPLKESERSGKEWLGALATSCAKGGFASVQEGIEEWERITGQNAADIGCNCCGPPHSFEYINEDVLAQRQALMEKYGSVYDAPEAEKHSVGHWDHVWLDQPSSGTLRF